MTIAPAGHGRNRSTDPRRTPVDEPAACVLLPSAELGTEWLDSYDAQPLQVEIRGIFRARVAHDRLHPRLVLPFALLLWGGRGAATLPEAALAVATGTVEDALTVARGAVGLPLPCEGNGRCEVIVDAGRWGRRPGLDPVADVVAALLHRGPCRWAGLEWPRQLPEWWRVRSDRTVSVAEDALRTAALVQLVSPVGMPGLLRKLAGAGRDEQQLTAEYEQELSALRHRTGFLGWKKLNHYGSRGHCQHCGADVYPAGASCFNCTAYPQGPDSRARTLDRLDLSLGLTCPARPGH